MMPTYVPWGFQEQTSPPLTLCTWGRGGCRKHSKNERAGATSFHRAAGGGLTKDTISSAAAGRNRPVEPGERLVGEFWPRTLLKVGGMERKGNEVLSMEKAHDEWEDEPGPRERNQVYRLEDEAAPRAAEALRRGADAARGRGQRKSRWYQRTGTRN